MRTCIELVCVLSRMSGLRWMKKVSCMSRAGCSGGKLRAENTCQSSSISGPLATVYPMRSKIVRISFLTIAIGCRVPIGSLVPGRLMSPIVEVDADEFLIEAFSSFTRSMARFFRLLSFCPSSRFISGETVLNSSIRALSSPFFPSILMRNSSTSASALGLNSSTLRNRSVILSIIL